MAEEQNLYKNLAKYYDLIYSFKNYKAEVARIKKLISKYKKSKENELLDVACGTGKHLQYLKSKYNCSGVDFSLDMLKIARKRYKDISFKKGNMINFRLNKKFDVITCLFSSIGHVKTYDNVRKTIETFVKHLKPGGVVIVEPWFNKSTFKKGKVHLQTYDSKDTKMSRVSFSKIEKGISVVDMHYTIGEKDKGVKYFVDTLKLGLFDIDRVLKIMKKAGFKAKYLKNEFGRGLYVGVKL